MSFARVFYPASGTDYNIPFSYQDASEVYVSVTGIQVLPGGGTWSFLNSSTIRFISTPAGTVQIRRVTQKASNKTSYEDGIVDVSVARNLEDTQLLYSVQEAMDFATDALGLDETTGTAFTARSKRIEDLGSPVGDNDAASRLWVLNDTVSFNFSTNEMDAHGYRITNVGYPTLSTDGASKAYVDDKTAGIVISALGISSSGVCIVASHTNFPGIDPTGVTNSSVGLNAALAAAITAGVPLFIPAGTYEFGATGQLLVTGACEIVGAGLDKTVLRRNALLNACIIQINCDDVTVRNLTLKYTGPEPLVATNPGCGGVLAIGLSGNIHRIRLLDLHFLGGFYVALTFQNVTDGWAVRCFSEGSVDRAFSVALACNTIRIDSCVAEGLTTSVTGYTPSHNTFYGYNINPNGTVVISDVEVTDCIARNTDSQGFSVAERTLNSKFTGCQAQNVHNGTLNTSPGFLVQNANGFNGERATFVNCAAIGCDIGFEINLSSLSTISGCRTQACLVKGAFLVNATQSQIIGSIFEATTAGHGIDIETSTKCQIIGAACYGNANNGIFEDATSDRNVIVGVVSLVNTIANANFNGTNGVRANNIIA